MGMKRYSILFTIVLSFLLLATVSNAQGPTTLNRLFIKLWPEYDDPRLLVIFDGELLQPNQPFRVPIPAGAFINAVASAGDDGRLINSVWESSIDDNGNTIITVTADGPLFRVEYYIPLKVQGDQRIIEFKLPPNYFVTDEASIEILLPPDSTDISLEPVEETNQQMAGGGVLLQRNLGVVAADQVISQKVSYRNPTGAMTMPETEKQPVAPAPEPAPTPATKSNGPDWLLVGLAVAAVVLIGFGAYGLWRTRTPEFEPELPSPKRKSHGQKKARAGSSPAGKDRFCRNCGAPFDPGDRYCRKCGAKRL